MNGEGFASSATARAQLRRMPAVLRMTELYAVGDLVTAEITNAGTITFVYMTDPEGNIIELQKWA